MSPNTKTHTTLANGHVVKIVNADPNMQNANTASLFAVAKAVGDNAVKEAFANGLPVTIGRDDKIIKLYPDGHEEIIGVL